MTTFPGGHQRIGHRYDIGGLDVRWEPTDSTRGRLVNLSVSGAGIIAPTDPRAAIGDERTIQIDGQPVEVIVRDIRPDERAGHQYYGVQFVDLPPGLLAVLNELIDGSTSGVDLHDVWNRAT
jgi:hypothetical protein